MSARVLGIGLATPETAIDQEAAAERAADLAGADDRAARALRALYRRSGVARRGAVVIDEAGAPWFFGSGGGGGGAGGAVEDGTSGPPTTSARMALYHECAPPLAERAARGALEDAGIAPASVTHLVTVSCTGFVAPGVDHALIERLPLDPSVQRTSIGFMGCHAAINALRVGASIVGDDPDAVVLVCCVELCSLHFQHAPAREGQTVANALFGDGAGAAVIGGPTCVPPGGGAAPIQVLATASRVFPDSSDAMTWAIGDHGFEMSLSARVPELLGRHVPAWIDRVLAGQGLRRADIGAWAVHPGGPRLVGALRDALGLEPDACAHSASVLEAYGNMSSPTILFILDRLMRSDAPRPWLALAFGPGLAGEAALLG